LAKFKLRRCGKLFPIDASAKRGALPGTEPRLLKLLTPRKENYIQCPQFKTGPTTLVFLDFGPGTTPTKGELKMGENGGDILKGGEPKKKKGKKKAAKKKAAKKK
jgi:hypothetical protein